MLWEKAPFFRERIFRISLLLSALGITYLFYFYSESINSTSTVQSHSRKTGKLWAGQEITAFMESKSSLPLLQNLITEYLPQLVESTAKTNLHTVSPRSSHISSLFSGDFRIKYRVRQGTLSLTLAGPCCHRHALQLQSLQTIQLTVAVALGITSWK
jgi:hypothetical protein